jgi:hypothetical protein
MAVARLTGSALAHSATIATRAVAPSAVGQSVAAHAEQLALHEATEPPHVGNAIATPHASIIAVSRRISQTAAPREAPRRR